MKIGSVALLLSAVALGAAVVALTRGGDEPAARAPVRTDRVDALERRVAELTREIAEMKGGVRGQNGRVGFGLPAMPGSAKPGESARPADPAADADAALRAAVDVAVDRKAEEVMNELRAKENKKPPIDLFASLLELTEEQRAEAERVIVEGQRELHGLLEIPTADGTNLMTQLVEIAARGMAEPGKDHGWGQWFGRVLTEKIPGTNETYATRIEALKNSMRASFQRSWSEAQYREFQQWGVDPTEIQGVPGSPNEVLIERITTRARRLGADIPD